MDLFNLLPQEVTSGAGLFLTVLTLIFYFAETLMGYKLIRSWISAMGFLAGAYGGFRLLMMLTGQAGYGLIGAIVGGILVSLLSYKVYLIGIFLLSAFCVYQLGAAYLPVYLTLPSEIILIASLLLGVLAGYLAVKYMRPAIILITAFHGGLMAASLLPQFVALPAGLNTMMLGLILGIPGTLVQFFISKKG